MANLTTRLQLNSNIYGQSSSSTYSSKHTVSSVFNTTFKVDNSDTFRELIEFKPDGTKTYNKFNYLLIANDGTQSAEIQIVLREFGTDDDIVDDNPNSATLDFVLHPGKFLSLPTSKLLVYSTLPNTDDLYTTADTSAGNKAGTSAYGVAYATTGPTFIDPPGYFIASQTNGAPVGLTASSNLFDADIEEDFFKNQQMGDDVTGNAEGNHLALFGECHADDVGTLQDISALGSSTDFANAKLTLGSITADKASGTTMYLGAYASRARLTGAHTASVTTITFENNAGGSPSSDGQMFKKYDVIRIGNELMQITGGVPHQTTFTVTRGVLGTTAVAHEDHDAIGFHYMNDSKEYLDGTDGTSKAATAGCAPMKGASNIYTNGNGGFYASSFFGIGRDFAYPNGLVPGSIAIKFYRPAQFFLGVGNVRAEMNSGLSANTAYRFGITVDGTDYDNVFTTDAGNVNLHNASVGTGVLRKIQKAMAANNVPANIVMRNGDITFIGHNRYKSSTIAVGDAGGGSGTQLFGQGLFPALTALRGLVKPTLAADEDSSSIMYDDGVGRLSRGHGGRGYINYETGAFMLFGCPRNSHMKIACTTNSALSGVTKSGRENYIPVIKARSLNAFRDALIKVVAYDDIIDDNNAEMLTQGVEADVQNYIQSQNPGGDGYSGEGSGGGAGGGGGY